MRLFGATLILPVEGNPTLLFKTRKQKQEIATGYQRVVIGKRGPYIEFLPEQIWREHIFIPKEAIWRTEPKYEYCFYIEYRTTIDSVKIYHQKYPVDYADYKVGLFYISPYDLTSEDYPVLIESDFLNIN